MMTAVPDYKRKALETRLNDLTAEYEAANQQVSYTLNAADKLKLQRQLDSIADEIEQAQRELGPSQAAAPPTSTQNVQAGPSAPAASFRSLRVFLSHASEDKPQVREVYRKLLAQGIDAWLDEERLLPGQDWQLEIRKAVRSSDAVLVFLSQKAVTKAGYVQKEIKQGLDVADEQPEGAIFLIPVRLEACDIPDRLSHVQWVNLYEESGWDRLRRALEKRAQDVGVG